MNELHGASILVTRPTQQAEPLCHLIEKLGGQAIRLPTIAVVPVAHSKAFEARLKTLDTFQWLVFISANAVNFALAAINGKIDRFRDLQIAAIGSTTAKTLAAAGLIVDMAPEKGFDSESLLAMARWRNVSGQRFLIVRGSGGRNELARELRSRGASVEYLNVYRRVLPDVDCTEVLARLNSGQLDAVTVTSGEALHNLLMLLGDSNRPLLTAIPLIAGSCRIAGIARKQGFQKITIADNPMDASMLEAVIQCTTGEKSGRIE